MDIRAPAGPARLTLLLVMALCAAARIAAAQGDAVTRARALAVAGETGEAITLLQALVAASPADGDTRVLLGTVLSWEKRYDEARRELAIVLAESPTHGDALPAAINVELWSDHPGRAEELARRGLRQRPVDPHYLLARARALVALRRLTDASDAFDRLLAVDPRNPEVVALRRELQDSLRLWQVRVGSSYDGFSDARTSWQESQVSASRTSAIGLVSVRGSRAQRFSLTDNQIEFEGYPRLRSGTSAYVAAAYSPTAALYPHYRYAVDLSQSLGAGFEGSMGFRQLRFARAVTVYVGSLSKYYGNWLFTGRAFVAPKSHGEGGARSVHASIRRYVGGGGTYVGLRYGRGAWRDEPRDLNDLEVLDSDVGGADAVIVFRRRLEVNVSGLYGRESRLDQRDLRQYSLTAGFGVRF